MAHPIQLRSDLTAEDDNGETWALADDAGDSSAVRVGAVLVAGTPVSGRTFGSPLSIPTGRSTSCSWNGTTRRPGPPGHRRPTHDEGQRRTRADGHGPEPQPSGRAGSVELAGSEDRKAPLTWAFVGERVTGIEPTFSAWESERPGWPDLRFRVNPQVSVGAVVTARARSRPLVTARKVTSRSRRGSSREARGSIGRRRRLSTLLERQSRLDGPVVPNQIGSGRSQMGADPAEGRRSRVDASMYE